jgi:hypothetical protein
MSQVKSNSSSIFSCVIGICLFCTFCRDRKEVSGIYGDFTIYPAPLVADNTSGTQDAGCMLQEAGELESVEVLLVIMDGCVGGGGIGEEGIFFCVSKATRDVVQEAGIDNKWL